MDQYYYIVSQLPLLWFDKKIDTISDDFFLSESQKWLTIKDYSILQNSILNKFSENTKHPLVLSLFKEFEKNLLYDISGWRKAKKENREYKTMMIDIKLLDKSNPLEIEHHLLKVRWDFLDELSWDHHFDLSFLIIYYLKLQILKRLHTFNKEKGLENFHKSCEVNL